MKVYISNYRNHWLSPYTILKNVCFWEKDHDVFYDLEEKGSKYTKWVNFLNPICQAWQKFLDIVHPRINYVKIDNYDTWNMDGTLTPIILPMLKQLKATKHGSAPIDMEDVPESMRTVDHEEYEDQKSFYFYHEPDLQKVQCDIHDRWDWVLDEMIFAFEHLADDSWQDAYRSGVMDWGSKACEWNENGKATMFQMVEGPNHTYKCDYDGMKVVEDRINNGLRLFGRYFRGLWD